MKTTAFYTTLKTKPRFVADSPAARVAANPSGCNLIEILSSIIGGPRQVEIAQSLLAHFRDDWRWLYNAHVEEIAAVHGVGPRTAIRIKAATYLGTKLGEMNSERPKIDSPASAAALVQHKMGMLEQEHMQVVLLDTQLHLIDVVEIYRGSVNMAQVRIAELFKPAIQRMAHSIILIHNHPSQVCDPSPEDVALTREVVKAGKLLDMAVQDHLIIGGSSNWCSLKQRGLGF